MKKLLFAKIPQEFWKKIAFLLCAVSAFLLIGLCISGNTEYRYPRSDISDNTVTEAGVPRDSESGDFVLRLEGGLLNIYDADGKLWHSEASTGLLTEYDKSLLEDGIFATKEELYAILEGLMS